MASLCLPGIENGNRYKYYLNMNHSENAIKYLSQNPDNIIWSILFILYKNTVRVSISVSMHVSISVYLPESI